MKGNTLNEFMSDLYTNGGPEKEFTYLDKYYIIQCDNSDENNKTTLRLDEYKNDNGEAGDFINTILFNENTLTKCVESFEKAKLFNGKTIYEAEKNIEVIFG